MLKAPRTQVVKNLFNLTQTLLLLLLYYHEINIPFHCCKMPICFIECTFDLLPSLLLVVTIMDMNVQLGVGHGGTCLKGWEVKKDKEN